MIRHVKFDVSLTIGAGCLDELPGIVGERSAILVASEGMRRRGVVDRIEAALGPRLGTTITSVTSNPTIAECETMAELATGVEHALVIGIGGGSALDAAKAVAAASAQSPGWLRSHLRSAEPVPERFTPKPLIAIPTTAGTGSEVTCWATIWDEDSGAKASLSHPALYPEAAILDPELTLSLPHEPTVASAFDAISHAMEATYNVDANPVSDALACQALALIPNALQRVVGAPLDVTERATLQCAATLAGLAFSQTRTALAHSMSYPLTAELGLPHGIACSFSLAEVLALNATKVPERALLIARALGCATVPDACTRLYGLYRSTGVDRIVKRYIPTAGAIDALSGQLVNPARAANNPVAVDESGARALVRRAYERLAR